VQKLPTQIGEISMVLDTKVNQFIAAGKVKEAEVVRFQILNKVLPRIINQSIVLLRLHAKVR
jgi:hypothetical protein